MKKILLITLIISLFFIVGCIQTQVKEETVESAPGKLLADSDDLLDVEVKVSGNWQNDQLIDVNSGESFKISDFKGKNVLIESFAVWCPTCTRQQVNMKKLHEEVGDSVVSVSLDTDPNEDEDVVKSHANANSFDWRYSVAPKAMVRALIDDFGVGVVNAPSAPVVLVCEDGSSRLMERGLKSVDELKEEISLGC